MIVSLRGFVILFSLMMLAGCSRNPTTGQATLGENSMVELSEVYKYRSAEKMSAPLKLQDLDMHEASLPTAYEKIRSGEYVVIWGYGLSTDSDAGKTILAYEKKAPTEGGLVMMKDGTVKEMSAAEFKSARKVGG